MRRGDTCFTESPQDPMCVCECVPKANRRMTHASVSESPSSVGFPLLYRVRKLPRMPFSTWKSRSSASVVVPAASKGSPVLAVSAAHSRETEATKRREELEATSAQASTRTRRRVDSRSEHVCTRRSLHAIPPPAATTPHKHTAKGSHSTPCKSATANDTERCVMGPTICFCGGRRHARS